MSDITVQVLGDVGPFSATGRSIGYLVQVGDYRLLVDCGAPLFTHIGGHTLKEVEAVVVTHCHEDHKRWFGDLALFCKYAPDVQRKVRVVTTEAVHDDLMASTCSAMATTLSPDAKRVVSLSYEDFVEPRLTGPRAKYRIARVMEAPGRFRLAVTDGSGAFVPPHRAKIVLHPRTGHPRLLFRDPPSGEWVEPESYYPFSSSIFYEADQRIYRTPSCTVEAVKASSWHGIASTGVKIKTDRETLIFSGDTVHDVELWEQLYAERRAPRLAMSASDFEVADIIVGDINDYIERTWSRERFSEAVADFEDASVIHDIGAPNGVVHTSYDRLQHTTLTRKRTLLAHAPDRFTSEWPLSQAGRRYRVAEGGFREEVGDSSFPLEADIYHKEDGRFYVGFKNEEGNQPVYEKDGLLQLTSHDGTAPGRLLYSVDLFEDLSGAYLPILDDPCAAYVERGDGKLELVRYDEQGSRGVVVSGQRARRAGN